MKQMSLEDFKKKAEDYLLKANNNTIASPYLTRIKEESEVFWKDSWDPEVMVQAMTSGLV